MVGDSDASDTILLAILDYFFQGGVAVEFGIQGVDVQISS
jgi:hypothetical protein